MPITIQVYNEEHKQGVITLILDIQQNEFKIPITIDQQPDLNKIADYYQADNGNFWVATIDGKVIGTLGLLDIGNSQGALRKMFVKDLYRGQTYAVGQLLLDTLLSWTKENKYASIFLGTTEKFIAAQKFYRRNGFKEISMESLPNNFPVMTVDKIFYRLDI
ncbi:N-acetyltransferase [Cytophagales bacterium WSM2-2]|nr:N-acetyltransferase [Cytophagales bacterium WSM2-2]